MNIREANQALVVADNNIGQARIELAKATKSRNHTLIQSAIELYNKSHDAYEIAYANYAEATRLGV